MIKLFKMFMQSPYFVQVFIPAFVVGWGSWRSSRIIVSEILLIQSLLSCCTTNIKIGSIEQVPTGRLNHLSFLLSFFIFIANGKVK